MLLNILSLTFLLAESSAYSCYGCRDAVKYFFEYAASPEEIAFQFDTLSRSCNGLPTAQEEMDCLINFASYWPDVMLALGEAEFMAAQTCTILVESDEMTCLGTEVTVCNDCTGFIQLMGNIAPENISKIAEKGILYLRGDGYCTGAGSKPENCRSFVANLDIVLQDLIPHWAEIETANQYCQGYPCPYSGEDETEKMLDGMVQLLEGSGTYDEKVLQDLLECSNSLDPNLIPVTDLNWAGVKKYANTHGQPGDIWKTCLANVENTTFYEVNCTTQDYGKIPIWEPCNYASNLAFYHTAIEICKKEPTAWTFDQIWGKFHYYRFNNNH